MPWTIHKSTGQNRLESCEIGKYRFQLIHCVVNSRVLLVKDYKMILLLLNVQICSSFYSPGGINATCIQCQSGKYNDLIGQTSTNVCKTCTESLATCETKKFVLSCGAHSICDRCHEHCHHCDTDGKTCFKCRHNLYLYNGTCVEQCPENYVEERRGWVFTYGRMIGNKCKLPLNVDNKFMVAWEIHHGVV